MGEAELTARGSLTAAVTCSSLKGDLDDAALCPPLSIPVSLGSAASHILVRQPHQDPDELLFFGEA